MNAIRKGHSLLRRGLADSNEYRITRLCAPSVCTGLVAAGDEGAMAI